MDLCIYVNILYAIRITDKKLLHFKLSKSGQILYIDRTCFPRPSHIYTGYYFCVMFHDDGCDNLTDICKLRIYCFITKELALNFISVFVCIIINDLIK